MMYSPAGRWRFGCSTMSQMRVGDKVLCMSRKSSTFASDFGKRRESSSFALRSHPVRHRKMTTKERNLNDESRTNHPHRNPSRKTQRRRLLLPCMQRRTNSPTMPAKSAKNLLVSRAIYSLISGNWIVLPKIR